MKQLFIVNPHAGRGKALRIWKQISAELNRRQIPYEYFLTSAPGEAEKYARSQAANYDQVILLGWDGTLHEVVNGLYGHTVKLGVIPAGTGNDFARMFNWSNDPEHEVNRLLRSETMWVDLVKMRDRVFIDVAGMGFDAAVAHKANTSRFLKKLGAAGYIVSVFLNLPSFKPSQLEIEVDGNTYSFSDTLLLAVGNAQSYGGGMRITPDADFQDGLLDICVVSGIPKLQLMVLFPKVFSGKHTGLRPVTMLRGKNIKVKTKERFFIHADGEILIRNHDSAEYESFEILPKSIELIV